MTPCWISQRSDDEGEKPAVRPLFARTLLTFALALPLAGCNASQAILDPHGGQASAIATLGWVMFYGAGLIFILVAALTSIAIAGRVHWRRIISGERFVILAGIVLPAATLTILLVYGLLETARLVPSYREAPLQIEVVGEQYWWRVIYKGERGESDAASANEIRIPTGRHVEFVLSAADVIHSFWVPRLGGKLDMIPGHVNRLPIRADRDGVYRGQCAEFCGAQHARMAFYVIAEPPEEFGRSLARERAPASTPVTPLAQAGKELFARAGCGTCHAVRGTEAAGLLGPDLTHIGSRRSIGAGMFPNNVGTLAGWIASAQHLKRGSRMPSFSSLSGVELRTLAAYLESLR